MTLGTQVLRFARGSMLQEGFPPIRLFRALIALCDDIGEEHDMLITSIVVWFNAVWRRLPQAYMTDEEGFTRELIELGVRDVGARATELRAFLGEAARPSSVG